MSEVTISTGHPDAGRIYAEALDRVTAERDAPQARLTAADERADVLEGLLREALPALYLAAGAFKSVKPIHNKVRAALKPVEGGGDEPNCLLCLDKKTVPSSLAKGYVMDCPDCCGEEG